MNSILAIEPNNVHALNVKGLALDDLGKYEEAMSGPMRKSWL